MRPGPSEPLPPLQKKRRRGLFHFRRHRSIKGERDPEDLPPSPPPPPMGGEEQEPPLHLSISLEEERKLGQDLPGTAVPLPGMGAMLSGSGVKGLPTSRVKSVKSAIPDTERAEPDSRRAEFLQPSRVQGVPLPGMGRAKGWSLDAKLEVTSGSLKGWDSGRAGGQGSVSPPGTHVLGGNLL